MSNTSDHRNDPRPRLGKCSKELLTGQITSDTLDDLLEECRKAYQKEIPKVPELRNTLRLRPFLLEVFSYVQSDGTVSVGEPTVAAAYEVQQTAQGILQAYSKFRTMAKADLKNDPEWREEYLSDLGPMFDRLLHHERFRQRIVAYDATGSNDWALTVIVDLYGLNDLIEYSIVLLALEPELIQTECPLPPERNIEDFEPDKGVIFGRCSHCHKYYVRTRVDQEYCSDSCRKGGRIPDELGEEREEQVVAQHPVRE